MIHAISWFSPSHFGVITPGSSYAKPAPPLSDSDSIAALLGRPVKHFARMTPQSQVAVCAAALALQATGWDKQPELQVGLLASDFRGSVEANLQYFRDYAGSGRTMGRGALFIYTLPTSILGAASIALSLKGPALHLHDDTAPLPALLEAANTMVADAEADGAMALWCDSHAAVCAAIGPAMKTESTLEALWISNKDRPLDWAQSLHAGVVRQ